MTPWLILCFALWMGIGVAFWRRLWRLRADFQNSSRPLRVIESIITLVLSVMALFMLFQTVQERAPTVKDLGLSEWLMIAFGGATFVVMQCIAVVVMLTLAEPDVTNPSTPPSINEGKDS